MLINFGNQYHATLQQFPFTIIDVGARGGIKKEWEPLRRYLKIIGFEPDQAEYEKLSRGNSSALFYINSALYDAKQKLTLYLTRVPGLSSVFRPNQKFLKHFHASNTFGYEVLREVAIDADRLDAVLPAADRTAIDFIKVDVEGCALQVLKGSRQTLSENIVLGLGVESEFNPKYEGQSLFSDVDCLLREHGYELFMIQPCSWKRMAGLQSGGVAGQLVHGDFVYFLDLDIFFQKISPMAEAQRFSKILKFITFACLYGCFDFAYDIILEAEKRHFLTAERAAQFRNQLSPCRSILFRLPKLQHRGVLQNILYHGSMLCLGIWFERLDLWKPRVKFIDP